MPQYRRGARDEAGETETQFRAFLSAKLSEDDMAEVDRFLDKMAAPDRDQDEPAAAQDRRLMATDTEKLRARVRRGALLSASEASQAFDAAFPMASHIRIS